MLKFLIVAGMFIGSFWIDDDFFDGYADFSRYLSVVLLIIQIVIIIDFSYIWNESWVNKYSETKSSFWFVALLSFSVIMWGISLLVIIYSYIWFTDGDDCGVNIFYITLTLVSGLFFTIFSLTNCVEDGSLLTSSAV
mmetsp:Transcript_14193/g.2281  ORF Transcript_14193/g.2281 Transcript_14193/m.2281 type:complete len:137 (+) Transcript_14193:366-776(+)